MQVWGRTREHVILAANAFCPMCRYVDDLLFGRYRRRRERRRRHQQN